MEITWYVCDLVTGVVLDELPLTLDGEVTRRIANEQQQTLSLPTADRRCPEDWNTRLVQGKTMIVLTVDQQPVQGWVFDERAFGDTTVPLQVSTLETCLTRTNVPDYDPGEPTIPPDLSQVAAVVAAPLTTRFGITIEWTACGTTNPDLTPYDNTEDHNLLTALNDLMAADRGPEWRIMPRWQDETTRRAFDKVLQIAPKIGMDRPDAVFELDATGRGNIETYTRTESFAAGKGATMVIGTSEGSGPSRPMTDPLIADEVNTGWPIWEERVNFTGLDADTIDDPDAALLSRARATLKLRQNGAVVWDISGDLNAPIPGRDYNEGDTVHVKVAPQGKRDPSGGSADVRVLGWTFDPTTGRAKPLLWQDGDTPDGTS